MAGEARRPWSPPPRRPRPRPDLQLPWRAGVACFSPQRPDRGGGAAGPAMRPPTRRGVHPRRCVYAHITWRGTRGWGRRAPPGYSCHSPRQFTPRRLASEVRSHTCGSPSCLGFVLLPAPKNAVVLVLVRIWNCAKRGVREVHPTARAAAVSPNDRAAWDDADDSLLASSVFLLQRMFSGFGFVGNRHNDRCGLDSPSNSPVPNHGATSVPSMPHFLETRLYKGNP